jgi:hypothetical protein
MGAHRRCRRLAQHARALLRSARRQLASPSDWLGLHKVFEVVPASLGLFLLSVAGNWLLIYGTDRDRGWRGEG